MSPTPQTTGSKDVNNNQHQEEPNTPPSKDFWGLEYQQHEPPTPEEVAILHEFKRVRDLRCIGCEHGHSSLSRHEYCSGEWREDLDILVRETCQAFKVDDESRVRTIVAEHFF